MEPIITPDDKWNVFYAIENHQEFIDRFQLNFFLSPKASPDIKGIFKVVQKLLICSYFEYEFVDVAADKAKLGLETALKIRYCELTGEMWPETKPYKILLEWFREKGYFEWDSKEYLHYIRTVRNLSAHAQFHSFGGMTSYQHVRMVVQLINDIYEDIPKRQERIAQAKSWDASLGELISQGCQLERNTAEPELVYFAKIAFINNKADPPVIHLCYKLIFPIPENYKATDPIDIYELGKVTCNSIQQGPGYFVGLDEAGNEVMKLTSIIGVDKQNTWNTWKADLEKYSATMILFDHANSHDVSTYITNLLSEFHMSEQVCRND